MLVLEGEERETDPVWGAEETIWISLKKEGNSGIPTPYCKAACWCLVPRKQTLAAEEMQGKGEDRDGLAGLTEIGMSSI